MVYLRRLAATLVNDLRGEAEEAIDAAATRMPGARGLVKLRGWTDLYERRHLTRGLLKLCEGTQPLHQLLTRERCTDRQIRATYEKPLVADRLTVGDIRQYSKHDTAFGPLQNYVTFDVQCRFGDDPESIGVLTVAQLPKEQFKAVHAAIGHIHTDDLPPLDATVGERILNAAVPASGLTGMHRGYMQRHAPEVAQTIVLAGIRQPLTTTAVPWRHSLRDILDFTETDNHGHDVEFPADLAAVVEELKQMYGETSRTISVDTAAY